VAEGEIFISFQYIRFPTDDVVILNLFVSLRLALHKLIVTLFVSVFSLYIQPVFCFDHLYILFDTAKILHSLENITWRPSHYTENKYDSCKLKNQYDRFLQYGWRAHL